MKDHCVNETKQAPRRADILYPANREDVLSKRGKKKKTLTAHLSEVAVNECQHNNANAESITLIILPKIYQELSNKSDLMSASDFFFFAP